MGGGAGERGECLGMSGAGMAAGAAIYAGFANWSVPEAAWDGLKDAMCKGDVDAIAAASLPAPEAKLSAQQARIDAVFSAVHLADLDIATADWPEVRKMLYRAAPLSLAVTLELVRRVRANPTMATALDLEYRFTSRSMAHGDFLEGIRAAIIDRDRTPKWQHGAWADVTAAQISQMTAQVEENT